MEAPSSYRIDAGHHDTAVEPQCILCQEKFATVSLLGLGCIIIL